MEFNAKEVKEQLVNWIKNWFNENGKDSVAVIGISGGKDSTVAAGLCVEALGNNRVLGVLMPCGYQKDFSDSLKVCEILGISHIEANMLNMFNDMRIELNKTICTTNDAETNICPRLRMATLYTVAQSVNGRVVNTSNLSEYVIGYFTRFGDECGDLKPLINLTCNEVIAIGDTMENIPNWLIHKKPDDGLPNSKPDEEKFGFTYNELDDYIRKGSSGSELTDAKIKDKISKVYYKHKPVDAFKPEMKACDEADQVHIG